MYTLVNTRQEGNMAHNLSETRGHSPRPEDTARGLSADYDPYFPSEQALASLLQLPN
jgi:hypothetical protein